MGATNEAKCLYILEESMFDVLIWKVASASKDHIVWFKPFVTDFAVSEMQSCTFFAMFLAVGCAQQAAGISVEKDLSLTQSQKNTLDKFRAKVEPLLYQNFMKTDIYLIRWLRARNFDLKAAENMLRENIRWRREQKIDDIQNEDLDDIRRDFHATIDTFDKADRPIGVIDIYDWDIRRAILQGKGQRLLRYTYNLLENITGQVFERQELGMNVTQFKVLGNADGFNLIMHGCPVCIPLWIQFVQVLENHYIGWLDELIIIDAPGTINVILEAIRPFLSRTTRDTFRIFGPNRNKWMLYMDERIAKDQRRPQYGGTKPQPQF